MFPYSVQIETFDVNLRLLSWFTFKKLDFLFFSGSPSVIIGLGLVSEIIKYLVVKIATSD